MKLMNPTPEKRPGQEGMDEMKSTRGSGGEETPAAKEEEAHETVHGEVPEEPAPPLHRFLLVATPFALLLLLFLLDRVIRGT